MSRYIFSLGASCRHLFATRTIMTVNKHFKTKLLLIELHKTILFAPFPKHACYPNAEGSVCSLRPSEIIRSRSASFKTHDPRQSDACSSSIWQSQPREGMSYFNLTALLPRLIIVDTSVKPHKGFWFGQSGYGWSYPCDGGRVHFRNSRCWSPTAAVTSWHCPVHLRQARHLWLSLVVGAHLFHSFAFIVTRVISFVEYFTNIIYVQAFGVFYIIDMWKKVLLSGFW